MMKNVKRSFAIALVAVSLIVGIGSAVNAGIELGIIQGIWKEKITAKRFFLTLLINAITVGMATLWVVKNPPRM